MKCTIAALLLIFGFQAHADFGAGVIVSGAQDTWDASGAGVTGMKSDGMTTRYGLMAWLPLFPGLSMRLGYLRETEKVKVDYSSIPTSNVTLTNNLVPINLQFGLPVTDLYIFGGAIFAYNDKVDPSGTWNNDLRLNAGLGYAVVDLGPAQLNVELEYQKGTRNLSDTSGADVKNQSVALNIGAQFGF
jgi:hypothetical protein